MVSFRAALNCCLIALILGAHHTAAAAPLRVLLGAADPPADSAPITTSAVVQLSPVPAPAGAVSSGNGSGIIVPTVSYGMTASPDDFPYVSFMEVTHGENSFGGPRVGKCMCTLIAPRVALTAGELPLAPAACFFIRRKKRRFN